MLKLRDQVFLPILIVILLISGVALGLTFAMKLDTPVNLSLGDWQLGSFPSGLAVFARNQTTTYLPISPTTDHVLTNAGWQEIVPAAQFTTLLQDAKTSQYPYFASLAGGYLDVLKPTYALETPTWKISYQAKKIEDSDQPAVLVTRELTNKQALYVKETGMTLKLDGHTVVFDPETLESYTQLSVEQLEVASGSSGLDIWATADLYYNNQVATRKPKVFLTNLLQPGFLEVSSSAPGSVITIDNSSQVLRIVTPVNAVADKITTSFTIRSVQMDALR